MAYDAGQVCAAPEGPIRRFSEISPSLSLPRLLTSACLSLAIFVGAYSHGVPGGVGLR